ncbi:MAG: Fic family protein [Nitrospira sp.]|nr:Fic family protein [Nitrospira sp.]
MKEQPSLDAIPDPFESNDRLQTAGLSPEEAHNFRGCFAEYQRALFLIKQYDEEGNILDGLSEDQQVYRLEVEKVKLIIKAFKSRLAERGENVENFVVTRNGGIEQVVGNIYQTWDEKDLYPYVEDKAVHLFYLLVKDHLFIDGNKRIASFLFIWLLDMNGMLVPEREGGTFTYATIYALAVLVAESNPKDKGVIIQFIRGLVMTHRKPLPDDEPYKNIKMST